RGMRKPPPGGFRASISNLQLPASNPWRSYLDNQDEQAYCRAMDEANTDVIQGTLDMLILKTLSLQPLHGFGITRRIEQGSPGVFKVNAGSLLTALQRLGRAGWLGAGCGRAGECRA